VPLLLVTLGEALMANIVTGRHWRITNPPVCHRSNQAWPYIIASDAGVAHLDGMGAAEDFVRDAFAHLKAIGSTRNTKHLFAKAGRKDADLDDGCIALVKRSDAGAFIETAMAGKVWDQEPKVRPLPAPAEIKSIKKK
jgi:hypothetical protein